MIFINSMGFFHVEHYRCFLCNCRCFTWNIGVFFCAMSLFHVEHWGVFIKRATTRDCPYNDIYQFYGIVSRGILSLFSVQFRCFTWNIGFFLSKGQPQGIAPTMIFINSMGLFHVEHYCFFLCNFVVSRGTLAFFLLFSCC